jgi:DNA-binding NarL/FixJ family response regulator
MLKPDLVVPTSRTTRRGLVNPAVGIGNPATAILVLSLNDVWLFAERTIRAGARASMKQESGDVLIMAIRQVLRGGVYLSAQRGIPAQSISGSGSERSQPDPG